MAENGAVRYALERMLWRAALIVLAAVFVTVILPVAWNLFSPFIIGLCAAAMLEPLVRATQRRMHARRGVAVALWVMLATLGALALLYWFCSFAVVQLVGAAENAPGIVTSVVGILRVAVDRLLGLAQDVPPSLSETIQTSLNSAYQRITSAGLGLAGSLLNGALDVAASLPYAFIYANFLLLAVWFSANRYEGWQSRVAGLLGRERSIGLLRRSAGRGLVGYVRVQFLFSLLHCLLSWVFFQSAGFSYAFLIGFAAGLLELIPQFGCGILYLPWSLICFLVGNGRNGWPVLGLYLGYTLVRRVTEPALLGNNLGISPLASLAGMFVGMRIGGVVGLILGPIVMVVLVSAVRSHLFDGMFKDARTIAACVRKRWKRGLEE